MYDLIIRGGTIVDGTGAPPFIGAIAISRGRIAEVGTVVGDAHEIIDAGGLLVPPGFVDVHTHYDGQATWDEQLAPSCWHGVTTVMLGNCGVGFAPVRPGAEQALIELMEGVEDIPGTVLAEGISWGWESFPDYLDVLAKRRWMIDVGTHVPHAAVRAYVMGNRANADGVTQAELDQMSEIVRAGVKAGALGVSTSRMLAHRTSTGEIVPGTFANRQELSALADVLRDLGTGVFEVVPRGMDGEVSAEAHAEMDWMGEIAAPHRPPPRLLAGSDPYRTRPLAGTAQPRRRLATAACRFIPRWRIARPAFCSDCRARAPPSRPARPIRRWPVCRSTSASPNFANRRSGPRSCRSPTARTTIRFRALSIPASATCCR
jgi:N-acyl-D-amino-acid deacylase